MHNIGGASSGIKEHGFRRAKPFVGMKLALFTNMRNGHVQARKLVRQVQMQIKRHQRGRTAASTPAVDQDIALGALRIASFFRQFLANGAV